MTSAAPGKTRLANIFRLTVEGGTGGPGRWSLYLVDLPGYGYAKVPADLREHWQKFINGYFQTRESLKGLVVVMDVRHPLREFDLQMLEYAKARDLPAHCLLTKADKLGRGAAGNTLLAVRKELGDVATVQLFSSENRQGIDEARAIVTRWLQL